MMVWECIWAGHRSHHFELFVILAINELYCAGIMTTGGHESILVELNRLAMHMDVRIVLPRARQARCISADISCITRDLQLLYEFRQRDAEVPPELRHIADMACLH